MDHVKVSREELLRRVQTNLEQHGKDFAETLEEWRISKLSELREWIVTLQNGDVNIPDYTTLVKPSSHIDDYERAIDMIKMSVEGTIDLSLRDFRQFVRDEWEWKEAFEKTKMFYASQQR